MPSKATSGKPTGDVGLFLDSLEHPLKREVVALRQIMLGVDPGISEEIKWNAPSFRTSEHFATMNLRARDCVQLILHFGAKKRDTSGIVIADPTGLLAWLGPDRASVKFTGTEDLRARQQALENVVRQWIQHV